VAQPNTDVLTHVLALARAVPASVLRTVAAQIEQHTEGVSPKVSSTRYSRDTPGHGP
jgi:hypothetical protein